MLSASFFLYLYHTYASNPDWSLQWVIRQYNLFDQVQTELVVKKTEKM